MSEVNKFLMAFYISQIMGPYIKTKLFDPSTATARTNGSLYTDNVHGEEDPFVIAAFLDNNMSEFTLSLANEPDVTLVWRGSANPARWMVRGIEIPSDFVFEELLTKDEQEVFIFNLDLLSGVAC